MGAAESFTTERYTNELLELSKLTSCIDDAELRVHIIERVNRMQEMLRPIVDNFLQQNPERDDRPPVNMQELMGPDGLG